MHWLCSDCTGALTRQPDPDRNGDFHAHRDHNPDSDPPDPDPYHYQYIHTDLHGHRDAHYYAIDSLRLEKGYRAWGRELTPDITPYEAGLGFAVALGKPGGFKGQARLVELRGQAPARRVVSLVVDAPHTNLWGGELILRDGAPVGFVTSAGYGHTIGRPVALGIITRGDGAADQGWIEGGRYEIDLAGERYMANVSLKAPYDPASLRVKS